MISESLNQQFILLKKNRILAILLFLSVLFSIIMLFVPLFRDLDYEYNAVTAIIYFLISGTATISIRKYFIPNSSSFSENMTSLVSIIPGMRESILFVFLMVILTVMIMTGASIIQGCCPLRMYLFFILLPIPAAVMGFATGILMSVICRKHFFYIWFALILTSLTYNLIILILQPPVFIYSVFWGYFAGPVYDDWIPVDTTLFIHGGIKIILAFLIWILAVSIYRRGKRIFRSPITLIVMIGLLSMAFVNHDSRVGFMRSRRAVAEQLSGYRFSGHINWYYDSSISKNSMDYLTWKGEYHFQDLTGKMKISMPKPMSIYVYRNAHQKKKLIGAGKTNIARIWNDEIHINYSDAESVIRHEMTHLFANEFGHSLYGSSSAGLLEGLAVAFEDDVDYLRAHQWAHVLIRKQALPDMKEILGQSLFFTSATGLRYTLAGSFCRYLIDRYGMEQFKAAYKKGSIDNVYLKSADSLIGEWTSEVKKTPVDSIDLNLATVLLQPSYTEKSCYHAVTDKIISAREYMHGNNIPKAIELLDQAAKLDPDHLSASWLKMIAYFDLGKYDSVMAMINGVLRRDNLHPRWKIRFIMMNGDLCAVSGHIRDAGRWYRKADDLKNIFGDIYIESFVKRHLLLSDTITLTKMIYSQINDAPLAVREIREKKDSLLNLWAGQLYYGRELWNDAMTLINEFAYEDSNFEFQRNLLSAHCLLRQGYARQALAHLERAEQLTRRYSDLAVIRQEKMFAAWLEKQHKGNL